MNGKIETAVAKHSPFGASFPKDRSNERPHHPMKGTVKTPIPSSLKRILVFGGLLASTSLATIPIPASADGPPSNNLVVWYDAAQVSAVGGRVATWDNQAEDSDEVTLKDSKLLPVVAKNLEPPQQVPNVVNGKPVIRFEGGKNILVSAGTTGAPFRGFTVVQPLHLFIVMKIMSKQEGVILASANLANEFVLMAFGGEVTPDMSAEVAKVREQLFLGAGKAQFPRAEKAPLMENFGILEAEVTEKLSVLRMNGEESKRAASGPNGIEGITVGGRNGGNFLAMDVAEILIYKDVLADPDRDKVQQYLGNKYKIAVQP